MNASKFHCACLALAASSLFVAANVAAVPYIPTTDEQVLERLPLVPSDPAARELRALRDELARQPERVDFAVALARRYTELGRVKGDPRFAGYAQAALARWWEQAEPPAEVLLVRATLRQRTHDFDAALADLAILLRRQPARRAGAPDACDDPASAGRVRRCRQRMRCAAPPGAGGRLGRLRLRAGRRYRPLARKL